MEAAAVPRPQAGRFANVFERRGFLASVLIAPAFFFIALLVGAPLVLAIWLSFTDATAGELSGNWVGLRNFREEFANASFQHAVWQTFLFTVASQIAVLLVAGFLAHALVKDFPGKWVLRFLILLPWAAPVALTMVGWRWLFDTTYSVVNWMGIHWFHLIDEVSPRQYLAESNLARWTVIAAHAWRIIPFATVIFLAGLASIPKEIDDAAAVDGATGFRKFWSVTLPLQLPIATVALLFGIVFTVTDMAVVYILTNGGPPPSNSTEVLTTWAFKTGIESASLGAGAAISLFLLPVLALVATLMLMFAKRVEVT